MSFLDDNKKCKKAFWYVLIFAIIFFIGCLVAFFYCSKLGSALGNMNQKIFTLLEQNSKMIEENKTLKTKSNTELSEEQKKLQDEKTTCDKEKETLTVQNNQYKAGMDKVKAYNEFFKYLNHVIEVHNGFTGWTDEEYNTAHAKAQETGDSTFVETVDWAWNRKDIDPTTRMIGVWKAIAQGIEDSLI